MGKYIRKSKVTGDVAVMEVSQSTTLGVRTRAKTLALQRLHSTYTSSSTAAAAASPPASKPDSCYLELRSRRLEKPPLLAEPKKQAQKGQQSCSVQDQKSCENSRPRTGLRGVSSGSAGSGSDTGPVKEVERFDVASRVVDDGLDLGLEVEASFGENNLEFEPRERSTRESTPCSFTRDVDTTSTPGSSTRRQSPDAANQRPRNGILRNIPSTQEMNEFFADAEQQQQRLFVEKYNFDIVNELPLPGRYEWVKVNY